MIGYTIKGEIISESFSKEIPVAYCIQYLQTGFPINPVRIRYKTEVGAHLVFVLVMKKHASLRFSQSMVALSCHSRMLPRSPFP
ncbi:MAG: hypothetical protein JETT_0302 [Candidatus Jettenia ecosi]|uniref:Uncharacterized protein n=1 Tax=Candidatus Jettenia ecosi TaxID=2494326 RepID=A0A533QFR7_9BACT|nr:MAG: hypothetical protein JETT_0302 [Candidatus Jettenia ecosi]